MALDVWGELTGHQRSLTHHPRFSRLGHPVSCSCVCMRETRCAFVDTEAEVGTLGHLRIHVLLTSELPRVVKSTKVSQPLIQLCFWDFSSLSHFPSLSPQ